MKFSKFALSALCVATLFSATVIATLPMQSQAANEMYQNSVIDSLINPLLLEIRKQKAIIQDADYISQQYLVYKDQRRLAGQAQGHDAALVASRNELLDKLSEFEILVTAHYLDLAEYSKSVNRVGEKFFVIGTVAKNSLGPGKATIENQRSFMLDLVLPLYIPDQQSLDYAFVAYGTKQSASLMLSEQLLYLPLHKDEFEQVVASYHGSLPDIAAHVYFGRIIPGLKYAEQFSKINADMAHHKEFLLGIENFAEWMQYKKCPICSNRIVGSKCTTPNCTGMISAPQPVVKPVVQPVCAKCSSVLVDGICPTCSKQPKKVFSIVAIIIAAAVVALGLVGVVLGFVLRKPTCQACGTKLENGICPNPSCPSKPHCAKCGGLLQDGKCPNPACAPKPIDTPKVPPEDEGLTFVPRPCELKNYDADATSVPTKFGFKVIAPACWADSVVDNLPRRFEVGRDAKKTPEGTPFLQLNLKTPEGDERSGANRCSRRYIRVTETEAGDGLNIDLLAETGNECIVNDKSLRNKGECATAYVGSRITLNPDWVLEVFDTTAK